MDAKTMYDDVFIVLAFFGKGVYIRMYGVCVQTSVIVLSLFLWSRSSPLTQRYMQHGKIDDMKNVR